MKLDSTTQDSRLLDAMMEAAVDAMIFSDAGGKMVRANPAACKLFGYDAKEMIGQSVNMLMPLAFATLHDGFMRHHIKTGEKRIIGLGRDVEGQRKDGSVFPLHLSVGHTEVEGEKFFIGILHDLSERRATQEALARSQRLDAVGQLTGGIAHDFNNLLTVIIGNLELLEMRGADDRQLRLIHDSLESAEMGADLTSRLLMFAKKGNLKPVLTDLREICSDALSILSRTIGAAYSINTEFPETLPDVEIDPVQLQSALINLALNSRDAMPKGGSIQITISQVEIDDTYMAQETDIAKGRYVRIQFSDNGDGMSIEAQRRAFEPFFTTRPDSGGTGLGLAMVYGFVRQSGGHITLYSELNHGTSFGLYFPIATDEPDSEQVSAQAKMPNPMGKGQKVLIVEDNPKVRRLSVERVRDLGYETLEAENGDEAFAMLQSGTIVDLVFSDVVMPGKLNGYDLASEIETEFPKIKILLTSGYTSDLASERQIGAVSHDILHKPYRIADLARRIHALLDPAS